MPRSAICWHLKMMVERGRHKSITDWKTTFYTRSHIYSSYDKLRPSYLWRVVAPCCPGVAVTLPILFAFFRLEDSRDGRVRWWWANNRGFGHRAASAWHPSLSLPKCELGVKERRVSCRARRGDPPTNCLFVSFDMNHESFFGYHSNRFGRRDLCTPLIDFFNCIVSWPSRRRS